MAENIDQLCETAEAALKDYMAAIAERAALHGALVESEHQVTRLRNQMTEADRECDKLFGLWNVAITKVQSAAGLPMPKRRPPEHDA